MLNLTLIQHISSFTLRVLFSITRWFTIQKKRLSFPHGILIWMASPSEMGGLYPPLAQRHSESAAKLVEGTDAGVSRWEEWAKLVQVSPFLLCLLRNPSPLDKLTSYLGEIWPGGGADKRGGKFHLIATYGKVQKRQWERYISKVLCTF